MCNNSEMGKKSPKLRSTANEGHREMDDISSQEKRAIFSQHWLMVDLIDNVAL